MAEAIDISNYTGFLGEGQVAWIRENFEFAIVRLSTEDGGRQRDKAAQQVRALHEGGVPWQGYLWCYWDQSPFDHWQRAQELLPAGWPGYHKLGIWLDMEDIASPAIWSLDWVNSYAQLLEADGFVPGVYTGLWWIRQHAGAFDGEQGKYWGRYPLWWAAYNGRPSCSPDSIGPWQHIAMHQYASVEKGPLVSSYDVSLICDVP